MFAADALSRYPSAKPDEEDDDLADEDDDLADEDNMSAMQLCATIITSKDVLAITVENVKQAALTDPQYQLRLQKVAHKTFAFSRSNETDCIKEYYNVKDRLSIIDNLIMYTFESNSPRLVIPKSLREKIIYNLHAAHQGQESILARARNAVYWPGVTRDIEISCKTCQICQRNAPSQHKEPMLYTLPPSYPFQQVVVDLCTVNNAAYLVYACRLTG